MKYPIAPKYLIALLVAIIFFGVMALSIVDPAVILDFFDKLTPSTDESRRIAINLLIVLGAIIMFFVFRHKRARKAKIKKK